MTLRALPGAPGRPSAARGTLLLALAGLGCGGVDRAEPGITGALVLDAVPLELPAGPGAAFPFVAPAGSAALISWTEPLPEGGHAIRMVERGATGWSEVRTIDSGTGYFVNWADFPSVHRLDDGTIAAHWLVRSGSGTYEYDIHTSTSGDGGASWSTPRVIHRDGLPAEHGFLSFFPRPAGFGAVWLDGRKSAQAAAGMEVDGHPVHAEMTLRMTTLDREGGFAGDEEVLDARICDCCQTAAAMTGSGPVVLYRDRSPEEIRDIHVVREVEGLWTEPVPLHADGWQISACPVNGPALSAGGPDPGAGGDLAAAWFTAAADTARVRVSFSTDSGASWSAPVRVDDGAPLGRVEIEQREDGSAMVVWLEGSTEGAEVRARLVFPDGGSTPSVAVAGVAASRASGFPRMARKGEAILLAWTEPGTPDSGGLARIRAVELHPRAVP